jgi:predicted nucleic acid-binding protein
LSTPSTAPPPRVLFLAEPSPLWQARPQVVLDCSVLVAHLFSEAQAADAIALMTGKSLHAPSLLPFEFGNVASKKLRSGGARSAVDEALAEFSDMRVDLHPVPPAAMLDLAATYRLSAYDAAYLWLAETLSAPLATFDAQLAAAAQRHLGRPR